MNDNDSLDLTDRVVFRHWQRITVRSTDEDPLGHVNNCIYAQWIEVARVMLIRQYLAVAPDGVDTALVSMTIDFLKETGFPGDVEVGARLLGIGNSSLRSGFGVFRDGQCLATSRCVNVFFDLQARRSVAPTEATRAIMEEDLA
ncbi:MAG: acyl-CoA thioesterase [Alphaproteobacteria bacterium]|nr:acyl-CoA thioesterase [Alphaproteobacteria bacterium]